MRCLLVYCHPSPESFNAAIRDAAIAGLSTAGHEVRQLDLYAEAFDPVLGEADWRDYLIPEVNERPVADQLAALRWAEALIFVYPTWWYGLPAILKGWLDRVFVPHATFDVPTETTPMRPKLTHIRKLAVITTCGAPWWWSKMIGEPGRRTILRGIRALCHRRCRRLYLALYKMDTVSADERARFLARVRRAMTGF